MQSSLVIYNIFKISNVGLFYKQWRQYTKKNYKYFFSVRKILKNCLHDNDYITYISIDLRLSTLNIFAKEVDSEIWNVMF